MEPRVPRTELNPDQSTTGFLKLKETCVNPTTGAPYIVSIKGGKDNSPEGLQVRLPDSDTYPARRGDFADN